MTLEAFALATRSTFEMEERALMRRVEVAAWVSSALKARGADMGRWIFGAGLCRDKKQLYPTILVDRSIISGDYDGLVPAREFRLLRDIFFGDWTEDIIKGLYVLPVALGFHHAAPGTELLSTMNGRMGPHVRWSSGWQGFLTAGHVAQTVGARVTDKNGISFGTVVWSNDPALAPSTNGDIDAALVAFDSNRSATTGRAPIIVGAGEVLTVAATQKRAAVLGFFDHVRLGATQACYSQCYATETLITQSGDSGGLVEARGDVAGMVIGGFSHRDMTLVQAIGFQLSEIRRRSGHMVSL